MLYSLQPRLDWSTSSKDIVFVFPAASIVACLFFNSEPWTQRKLLVFFFLFFRFLEMACFCRLVNRWESLKPSKMLYAVLHSAIVCKLSRYESDACQWRMNSPALDLVPRPPPLSSFLRALIRRAAFCWLRRRSPRSSPSARLAQLFTTTITTTVCLIRVNPNISISPSTRTVTPKLVLFYFIFLPRSSRAVFSFRETVFLLINSFNQHIHFRLLFLYPPLHSEIEL